MSNFDAYNIDVNDIACNRMVIIINDTYVARPFLLSFSNELQELINININVLEAYDIDEAKQKQLDNIGDLLGLKRVIENTTQINWFTWDSADADKTLDVGLWYVTGANKYNTDYIDDETYRARLKGQAFKNRLVASVSGFYIWCKTSYNLDVSLIRSTIDNREWILVYKPEQLENLTILQEIVTIVNTNYIRNTYFSPMAIGNRITHVAPVSDPAFTFDVDNNDIEAGWDTGKWTVYTPVSVLSN